MKKIALILSFILSYVFCFGQPVSNRSNPSVTVSDARLQAALNLYVPRYADTTSANLSKGIDSCGALIYTYDINNYWIRQCNPKRWAFIGGINIFNSSSVINIIDTTILNQTEISICTGNGACDTFIVNTTVRNITTGGFLTDTSVTLCDTLGHCNTAIIPRQQVYVFQQGLKSPFPGIAELGGTFIHDDTINTNGLNFILTQTQTGGININQLHAGSNANLELNNPGSIGLGFSGNGVINSSNTDISFTGYTGLVNAVFKFYSGVQFPQFPNTLAPIGIASKFFAPDVNGNFGLYTVNPTEQCGLQSGDIVTFDSTHNGQGYYDVSNGSYCINQNDYSNPITLVIIPQGDSNFQRVDYFFGDTFSVVTSKQGTPAANPVAPQLDPNSQIGFTTVTINPLDSLPSGLTIQNIYDQNLGTGGGEFNPSAVGLAVNFANTVNPLHLTIAADVGAITNGDQIRYIYNTQLTLSNYTALKFYIRLKSAWAANVRMSLQWTLGNAVISTNNVNIGGNASLYNFSRTTVGAYMVITIPTTAWSRTTDVFDGLRLVFTGANAQGIYLDWIQLQGGIIQSTGGNPGIQSFAMTGNIVETPVVANPTGPNVSVGMNLTNACAGCFLGNQTGGSTTPTYSPINLSNNGNFTGTLNPIFLTPGAEGSILQVVSGVPTFTLLPLGYDTTFVVNGLSVIPGVSNDTLLWGGTLRQATTINQAGNTISFLNGNVGIGVAPDHLLDVSDGTTGFITIDAFNGESIFRGGNLTHLGYLDINATAGGSSFNLVTSDDGASTFASIFGDATAQTITLTAANGVAIADYIAGASTDSVVTWDAATGVLKMRNASSLGTTPNLQAVTDVGAITTHTVVSRINFESQPSYESDFVSALSFTGNGVNAEGALILREWSTGGGDLLTLSPVTALSGNITLRLPNGNDGDTLATQAYARSIVGTTLQAKADLTAQTTAVSSVATFTPSANGTFRIGGYINITAVTAGIVTLKVTYTDENSQSVTQIIPLTIATTGAVGTTATVLNSNNSATDILIRAKSGGAITVLTTLANVATYDVGARIEQL